MCVFCAAIPVAAAVGARANAQQLREQKLESMDAAGKKKRVIPAGRVTAVVIAGLMVGSVTVHTHAWGI